MSESGDRGRLEFIDFTRGLVMILMAWDHVSGFWNPGKMSSEGLQGYVPPYEDLVQFLLRFMTHVCAPTFMFLAGTSLALSTWKRRERGESEMDISKRMIARGTMMLLLAIFLVGPSLSSSPFYFGVIACFGVCFIIFSFYRRLPTPLILLISLAIVLFHPYINLDWIPEGHLWTLLKIIISEPQHSSRTNPFSGLYPIFPWIGVMGLGWCFGVFLSKFNWNETHKLKLPLAVSGIVSIILFYVVRWVNGYGNLVMRQGSTVIAWLSISKYPPSVAFLLWTLGLMSLFMALGMWFDTIQGRLKSAIDVVKLYGQTALFFYCIHLPLYRVRPLWWQGRPFDLDLYGTAVLWVIGLGVLWWLCKYFLAYKRNNPNSIVQYI